MENLEAGLPHSAIEGIAPIDLPNISGMSETEMPRVRQVESDEERRKAETAWQRKAETAFELARIIGIDR